MCVGALRRSWNIFCRSFGIEDDKLVSAATESIVARSLVRDQVSSKIKDCSRVMPRAL